MKTLALAVALAASTLFVSLGSAQAHATAEVLRDQALARQPFTQMFRSYFVESDAGGWDQAQLLRDVALARADRAARLAR